MRRSDAVPGGRDGRPESTDRRAERHREVDRRGGTGVETPHHGRWFEDLPVGLVVPHALTRTITETDNILFSTMTLNPARLHLGTEFGRPLVNSLFTLGLLVGISVLETTHGTTVANLGFEEVTFPTPMFAGDTLHGES